MKWILLLIQIFFTLFNYRLTTINTLFWIRNRFSCDFIREEKLNCKFLDFILNNVFDFFYPRKIDFFALSYTENCHCQPDGKVWNFDGFQVKGSYCPNPFPRIDTFYSNIYQTKRFRMIEANNEIFVWLKINMWRKDTCEVWIFIGHIKWDLNFLLFG